jgi:hypothetical protein
LSFGIWVLFALSFLDNKEWWNLLMATLCWILITVVQYLSYNFRIRIDRHYTSVQLRLLFIPFKVIKVETKDLIIDHSDATGISIISPRRDYYKEDVKNNLRFSYIMPWDGDESIFYIDYHNREIDFDIACHEFAWNSMITALKNLDNKRSQTQ